VNLLVDGSLRIACVICSEDLDAGRVRKLAVQNPNLLVAIVSDAWFGDSSAPRQHLALAGFRAVETRRTLVRVTNTGVSAVIAPTGRVLWRGSQHNVTPANPSSPERFVVEVPLLAMPTPALRIHPFVPWLCLLALFAIVMVKARRQRQHGLVQE
jgi:apolipoprotein N-acyltransferase